MLKTEFIWDGQTVYAGPNVCESGNQAHCGSLTQRTRWDVPDGFRVPCAETYYLDQDDGKCKQETCVDFQYLGKDGRCTATRCLPSYILQKDGRKCVFD